MPRNDKPPKEYQFKPGQSGNPAGRPANPIPNALKKLTRSSLKKIIKAVVKGNLDEIKRIAKDPKSSGLEVAVASCFAKATERGDFGTIEKMLERLVGKVPDELNINSRNLHVNVEPVTMDQIRKAVKELESKV